MVPMNAVDDDLVAWLLEGDASIRWRVHRDLIGSSASTVGAERVKVATEGWGAKLLSLQSPDGRWGGGDYTPKWTSTTYTLPAFSARAAPREAGAVVALREQKSAFAHRSSDHQRAPTDARRAPGLAGPVTGKSRSVGWMRAPLGVAEPMASPRDLHRLDLGAAHRCSWVPRRASAGVLPQTPAVQVPSQRPGGHPW